MLFTEAADNFKTFKMFDLGPGRVSVLKHPGWVVSFIIYCHCHWTGTRENDLRLNWDIKVSNHVVCQWCMVKLPQIPLVTPILCMHTHTYIYIVYIKYTWYKIYIQLDTHCFEYMYTVSLICIYIVYLCTVYLCTNIYIYIYMYIYVFNGSTLLFSARCFPGAWLAMELHRSWVIWPKREVVGPSSGALVTPK